MREFTAPQPNRDPLDEALLPGGALGNHGRDAEITGLRPRSLDTSEGVTTVRCAGGVGWCVDALGRRELYPTVGDAVFAIHTDDLNAQETAALRAWCHEGVPVRARGVVGDTPLIAFDDGSRTVLLPRARLRWHLSAGDAPERAARDPRL